MRSTFVSLRIQAVLPVLLATLPALAVTASASSLPMAARLAVVSAFGGIAVLVAVRTMERRVRRPLGRIGETMTELLAGELTARTGIQGVGGEAGRIAGTLDALAVAVERQQRALNDAGAELRAFLSQPLEKMVQQTLRDTEARFRAMFDSSPIGIALLDDSGRALESNVRLCELLGLTPVELQRRAFTDSSEPADGASEWELFTSMLAGERDNYALDIQCRKADGQPFSARATAARVREGDADPYVIRMVEDVTSRLALEAQLRQSQKMEAIGQLAGGIAHDFNNLLMVVLGHSDRLCETLPEQAGPAAGRSPRSEAEAIRDAAARAASLTQQLLAFSRRQQLELRPLDLNAVVENITTLLRRVIGETIVLRTTTAADLGTVCADATQIEQVLMNLAVNARDAMPEGGSLLVETANASLDDGYAACHVGIAPGEYVMLAVTDTGMGMDAETRARAFEPFFTTKPQGHGTGLGLSTVFGIVKQCGGTVWLYSEPGRGTTFKIYLPRTTDRVQSQPAVMTDPIARGTETILLVEDERGVRSLLSSMLEAEGYTVVEASSGEEAIVISSSYEGTIHAMVSDVIMPGLTGPELQKRLASTRPGMKVLFMSGYTDNAVHARLLDPNSTFLGKPFTRIDLARKLRLLLSAALEAAPAEVAS
jgi:PAS domain S-box-containing protein